MLHTHANKHKTTESNCSKDKSKNKISFMKVKQIWSSNIDILSYKLTLFNTLVKLVFYGSETWKINEGDNRTLDTFLFKCLRRILQIRWSYVVSNQDILGKTKLEAISTEVKLRRWQWVGHIL